MGRIRTIKPEFFDDPEIGELSIPARFVFIGLWTQADRVGRLEDDPQRLKLRLLYFSDVVIDPVLEELADHGFIIRYRVGARSYIQIKNFEKHQRPHPREAASAIPAPPAIGKQPKFPSVRHGGVYGIVVDNKVKVGQSRQLAIRAKEVMRSLPNARLAWSIGKLTAVEARNVERKLHRLFSDHHIDSEWFTANEITLNPPILDGHVISRPSNAKDEPSRVDRGREGDLGSGKEILDLGREGDLGEHTHARALQSGGVGAGTHPRDHLGHSFCAFSVGDSTAPCVPKFLHGQFLVQIQQDTDRLTAFYRRVAEQTRAPCGDEPLKFWRAHFTAELGEVAPKGKTAGNVAALERFVARHGGTP